MVVLVTPQVAARFTGQHEFVNGSSVKCQVCHTTISEELHAGDVHNWSYSSIGTSPCRVCHIPNTLRPNQPYYNPYQNGTGTYHAAALVECTYCHGIRNGTTTDNGGLMIPAANITHEFVNSNLEAHKSLYYRAENASGKDTSDLLKGTNEACVACHTYAANVTVIGTTQYLNITANSNCNTCNSTNQWNVNLGLIK